MDPAAPHLVDEILEEIFLRLPTPAALARTSMASVSFRSIITERSFLRRYRKRHPPPLLGFVDPGGHHLPLGGVVDPRGFHPAQAHHPSAPLTRAIANAADFTYSFVAKPLDRDGWRPSDVRDGRVLLKAIPRCDIFPILAVCDPLSRRYLLLPLIPEGLAEGEDPHDTVPILAPIREEDEDETSFKVICVSCFETKLVAFLYSSVTRQWCIAASLSYPFDEIMPSSGYMDLSCFYYAHGCFYFPSICMNELFLLDTQRMEFSTVGDPTGYHVQLRHMPHQEDEALDFTGRNRPGQSRYQPCCVVVGREGALEMFSLVGDHSPNGSFHLYHTTLPNNGEPSKEWQL